MLKAKNKSHPIKITPEIPIENTEKIQILWEPLDDRFLSLDGLRVSEPEYWEKYYEYAGSNYDANYEWNDGYLEEKPMTDPGNFAMYNWFYKILDHFLEVFPIATKMGLEFGFRLAGRNVSIRKPDLTVILNTNPVVLKSNDRSFKGVADLCIESISTSSIRDIERDRRVKKSEYEIVGVREYYILDASGRDMAFYRRDKQGRYRPIRPLKGDIIKSEVLKGFQFRISDLFRQPFLEEIAEDDVYKKFILLSYQEQKQQVEIERARAEAESKRADTERDRAEKERQRAEKERQRAKNLEKQLIEERKKFAEQLKKISEAEKS